MCIMPKAFPKEFRQDVIRVYRDSDASVAQAAILPNGWSPRLERRCVAPPFVRVDQCASALI